MNEPPQGNYNQRRWIAERLRYDRETDISDLAGGIIAILDDTYQRIEQNERHIKQVEELIKAVDRQSALNRTALVGDLDLGIEGVMAGQKKIDQTLRAITDELTEMRIGMREIKRTQTINIAMTVALVTLILLLMILVGFWSMTT